MLHECGYCQFLFSRKIKQAYNEAVIALILLAFFCSAANLNNFLAIKVEMCMGMAQYNTL